MDEVREIEFAEALGCLQALLGRRVRVVLNVYGSFAGCFLEGELERVETVPPDDSAVNLVIASHQGILLDPEDVVGVLLAGDAAAPGQGFLEFHLPCRVAVTIELA